MKYLLDTNICIYIIKQKPRSVKQRFQSFDISDMGISIVTLGELEWRLYPGTARGFRVGDAGGVFGGVTQNQKSLAIQFLGSRAKETGFLAASGVASQRFKKSTRFLRFGNGVKSGCYPLPGAPL